MMGIQSGIDVTAALGQQFGRWIRRSSGNKQEMEQFLAQQLAQGHAKNTAKADFRKRWAAKEMARISSEKTWEQAWQEVDEEKGTYLCFASLVETFGFAYDPRGATKRGTTHPRRNYKYRLTSLPQSTALSSLH